MRLLHQQFPMRLLHQQNLPITPRSHPLAGLQFSSRQHLHVHPLHHRPGLPSVFAELPVLQSGESHPIGLGGGDRSGCIVTTFRSMMFVI